MYLIKSLCIEYIKNSKIDNMVLLDCVVMVSQVNCPNPSNCAYYVCEVLFISIPLPIKQLKILNQEKVKFLGEQMK
jgi:hypothetical protein